MRLQKNGIPDMPFYRFGRFLILIIRKFGGITKALLPLLIVLLSYLKKMSDFIFVYVLPSCLPLFSSLACADL